MDIIVSSLIAAVVALIGAIISFVTNRRAVQAELKAVEIELTRKLTEKLYDKRLEVYPLAWEITGDLLREDLSEPVISKEYLEEKRQHLIAWHRKNGLLISEEAVGAYYELRNALTEATQTDSELFEKSLKLVWQSKNYFRSKLRKDLHLLYIEENAANNKAH